ncbi:MAG: hypothetical protein J6V92_04100 [Bacteroidaceae bacterium]|nr:hypothetical protein [Bacteroidaceae bacterium]
MKKRFLTMFLLGLMGVAGNFVSAVAQTPEPTGQWRFDNPSDLMEATVGSMKLIPAVLGSASVSVATVEEAGITAADGQNGSSAILLPATSALKVERVEDAATSMSFSIMIDIKVPDAYSYDCLFQTSPSNGNDGEVFISKSQIGAGALGGYFGCIWDDVWYRVVLTNSNGSFKLYVNGEKIIDYETSNTRWEIDPVFYLFADDDSEKVNTYISEVAFWETPLTDEEVSEMGGISDFNWITDVSQINEGDQFYIISDRAKFAGNTTAKPKAMACSQSSFPINWGDQYVYWGDLNKESDGFIWTAEKAGDQWAFLNKENGKYLGNKNTGEDDVIFSDAPVGYTLTDLTAGAGRFYMTNEESEHSLHVQGYLRSDRANNSLAKQEVGDDDYSSANSVQCGYPGRWHFVKIGSAAPVETGMKIETLDNFIAFAEAVNGGQTDLEAYLAADIDLGDSQTMVGTYAGTFDGKGHKIIYNYTDVGDHSGLFKALADGAVICNLYVEGTASVKGIHYGALAGDYTGNVLVENVVTNVNITGDRSGVTGDGGMAGYVDGTVTFNNCATLGKMGNAGSSMYCGFVAFATNTSTSILNNCYTTGELTEGTSTDYCYTFCRGTATLNNCYYLNAIGEVQGTAIDAATLATGEFCYMLNGDQLNIGWYQTLDEDDLPVPFDSHLQVFANGELKCDGTSAGDGELVYSNSSTSTIPPHTFDGGFCAVCGTWDADYQLATDGEGFSLIASAKDFAWFAEYLAKGKPCLNVKLTADIDLSTDYPDVMLASESNRFSGIFDGGYHTITYNYTNVPDKWRGLFRSVENATIRNLYVEGSATPTNIHFGALIGVAYGTVLVENVVTNVNITGKSSTGVQGDAGMLGANYADITFNNCATLGEMGYKGTSMYSSFSGWSNGSSNTTLNNCFSMCKLTDDTGTGNCFTLTHTGGPITINNSYYLYTVGTVQGTAVTAEQIAGGTLCYKLNGDQSVIAWTQALDGTEPYPTPDPNGQRVYASGTARCDGVELEESPFTYTNTESYPTVPDHQYGDDDICVVCGTANPNAVEQDAEGYYLIGTAKQLNWFAKKVEKGAVGIKARLTADIDLSSEGNEAYADLMVGTEANPMQGIFDGSGYTITYNYTNVADKWRGLFAFVKDATIRNLYVEGSAVVTNIHFGALIGHAEGTVLVENVITNVNITGQKSGVTGDGGMLGANYANITFNNCATLGKMGYPGSSMYSSFSAWSYGGSSTTLNNCYSLCELTEGTGTGNCFTLTHQSGTIVINNSYYLNLIGTYVGGTQVTAEQVANGELCDMLGAGWYQNIGTDAYPVFDKTHNVVKVITDAGYATMYIPDAVEIPEGVDVFTGEYEESWLKLNPVEEAVPAWEPVVLKGTPGIYSFAPVTPYEVTTEVVFADLGFMNGEELGSFDVGDLSFSFYMGENENNLSPKYFFSGSAVRIYAGNDMEIFASGALITKIEFTFATGASYVLREGSYDFITGDYSTEDNTWTGSANKIILSNIGTGQFRIVSMTVTMFVYETPDNIKGNVLKGAAEDVEAVGKYVLAKPEGEQVGFYMADTGIIKAGKAYLENGSGIKAFYFNFNGDDATDIKNLNDHNDLNGATWYDLNGRKLSGKPTQKGIYINNGRKIAIK